MPIAPTYPGVYVQEIPSGVHPITGVATAVGAFIGWFPKGQMDTAVELLSFADVEREFGGLSKDSDTSFALAQYFLNGGARAYAVRVAAPGAGVNALGFATGAVTKDGGGTAFTVSALSKGQWGNSLRVQVIGPYRVASEIVDRFDLQVLLTGPQNGRNAVVQQELFRGLTATVATDANFLPVAVNGVSKLVTVVPGAGGAADVYATPAGSGAESTGVVNGLAGKIGGRKIDVTMGGNTATVALPAAPLTTTADVAAVIQSAIRTTRGGDPVWSQASVIALANNFLQIASGIGDSANVLVANNGDTTASSLLKLPTTGAAGSYRLSGGGDGDHPTATEIIGSPAAGSGMFALENTDFTLLCLPSIANFTAAAPDHLVTPAEYFTVAENAIAFCQKQRAMVLLDPPDDQLGTTALQNWLASHPEIRDEYSALYYPRVTIADPTQTYQPRSIGPSGTIAGLMSRIDTSRGVWKAPAGTEATLLGLQQLDDDLTDPRERRAQPAWRQLPAHVPASRATWSGARARCAAPTSWRPTASTCRCGGWRCSSRRASTAGTQWVVFEPNDEPLWSQIRLNVGAFMQDLFRQGAFQGTTPRDAYFVKCDSETTTQADIDHGIVNIVVGFAPLKPAEFVVLQIQQIAGQIDA